MLYQIVKEVYTNYLEKDMVRNIYVDIVNRELGTVNPVIIIIIII